MPISSCTFPQYELGNIQESEGDCSGLFLDPQHVHKGINEVGAAPIDSALWVFCTICIGRCDELSDYRPLNPTLSQDGMPDSHNILYVSYDIQRRSYIVYQRYFCQI